MLVELMAKKDTVHSEVDGLGPGARGEETVPT
jgi:hypothetical protein